MSILGHIPLSFGWDEPLVVPFPEYFWDRLVDYYWVWMQFSVQCIDQAYWGIFPHFEVTRFLSDSVRDLSETCFYFWDYHIPHHFGYSFEIRFRVSTLGHWSILHSDFLADYCWAEDNWLMMLDSSFGCALYIHTGAYSPFPWDSYLLLCGMTILIHGHRDVGLILTDSLLYIRYPYWGIFPSHWWDCV